MKRNIMKIMLGALLIMALLTPVAMMEEAPAGELVTAVEIGIQTEEVPEEALEEATEDVADNVPKDVPEDVLEAAVIPEAVDAVVTEVCDIALDGVAEDAEPGDVLDEQEDDQGDAPTFEAEVVEESLDDIAEYEAAEEVSEPEPEGEAVAEETAEDSAKAMAEAAGEIPIDEAHFPDAGFRQYIIDKYDTDKNGYLSANERDVQLQSQPDDKFFNRPMHTMFIYASGEKLNIQSLAGIEYFNVQIIKLDTYSLATLDLSNISLPDLVWLEIKPDQYLTSIKLGNKPKLEILKLYGYDGAKWTTSNVSGDLDLTGCPSMRFAHLGSFNNLKRIYINPNSELNNIKFYMYLTEGNSIPLKKAPKFYVHKKYRGKDVLYGLTCAHNTKLITNAYIPASGVEQIACTGKRAKATVNAGTTFQINPGATAGKKFKSSKKKVATVSSNGIVTAKAKGKTKITFKVGKKKRTLTLTVNDPTIPTSVALSAPTTAVKKGDTVTLTPVVPENTNPGGYKWKSSNKKVATVDNGVVTFKKAGKVTITCTATRDKKKAKLKFTVSK